MEESGNQRDIERIGRAIARTVQGWSTHQQVTAAGRGQGASGQGVLAHRVRNLLAAKDRPHFVAAVADAVRRGYVIRQQGSDRLHPGVEVPGDSRLGLVADLDAAEAYTR